jgi:hypothetical protein
MGCSHKSRGLAAAALLLLVAPLCAPRLLAGETLAWKLVGDALLKMDERPVKLWNVYHAEKKPQFVLVQLGYRYLFLNTKAKEVFEMDPGKFQRKGKEFRSPLPDKTDKLLLTSDWVVRSVGRAQLIRVKLTAEGRVLEVQLPQKPDLRSLY